MEKKYKEEEIVDIHHAGNGNAFRCFLQNEGR
jgi:hypothetical protein